LRANNFDAVQRITGILAQAETTILIVDGYIDASLLELLSAKKPVVEVRMMTKSVSPSVKQLAIAFNKQYGKLSIRTSIAFHDRFVVIDDHEFYHFGASLKDAGRHGFMFSRIEEPRVIDVCERSSRRSGTRRFWQSRHDRPLIASDACCARFPSSRGRACMLAPVSAAACSPPAATPNGPPRSNCSGRWIATSASPSGRQGL